MLSYWSKHVAIMCRLKLGTISQTADINPVLSLSPYYDRTFQSSTSHMSFRHNLLYIAQSFVVLQLTWPIIRLQYTAET